MQIPGLKFFKSVAAIVNCGVQANTKTIDNLPVEIVNALNSPTVPAVKFSTVLAITNGQLTKTAPYSGKSYSDIVEQSGAIENFVKCYKDPNDPAILLYPVGNMTATLWIYKQPGGEISTQLQYFLPPSNETVKEANRLGIHVYEQDNFNAGDIAFAIQMENTTMLIQGLANLDEILTGNKLGAYKTESHNAVTPLSNDYLGDLEEKMIRMFEKLHVLNPFHTFRYDLGDKNGSKLLLKIDKDFKTTKVILSFELDSRNPKLIQKFEELKRKEVIKDFVLFEGEPK